MSVFGKVALNPKTIADARCRRNKKIDIKQLNAKQLNGRKT